MTKIYAIYGVEEAVYNLNMGKVSVRCEFVKGFVDGTRNYPAKLQTNNPIVQIVIENSPLFNNKIFLLEEFSNSDASQKRENSKNRKKESLKKDDAKDKDEDMTDYPDIVTLGDAMNVLKSLGASASEMRNKEKVLSLAQEYRVTFSNLK